MQNIIESVMGGGAPMGPSSAPIVPVGGTSGNNHISIKDNYLKKRKFTISKQSKNKLKEAIKRKLNGR